MQNDRFQNNATASEARVAEFVSQYVDALNRGESPDRESLLAELPEYQEVLGPILRTLDALRPDLALSTERREEELKTDSIIGDFRIIKEVGQGAMGKVYEAEQISFNNRTVALKVLSADLATPERIERFLKEAEAAGQLRHANIVPIFCRDYDKQRYFYAMEFVRGYSLRSILALLRSFGWDEMEPVLDYKCLTSMATAPIAPSPAAEEKAPSAPPPTVAPRPLGFGVSFYKEAARLFMEAADGLYYAHTHGVVHRDITPANLILDDSNRLRITDFGLALNISEITGSALHETPGTPPYMSPEQLRPDQRDVDGRSDVYSLAITLYELVTLRRAIPGETVYQIVRNVESYDPPPPRKINPEVPKDLDTVITKAIGKDPRRRYQTARAFAQDLANFIADRPVYARGQCFGYRTYKFVRRHRVAFGSIAVALLCLGPALMYAGRVRNAYEQVVERWRQFALKGDLRRRFEQAQYDLLADDPDAALGQLATVISESAPWAEARFLRGTALQRKGDLKAAIEDYSRAIQIGPPLAAYYRARANAYRKLKQPERAERDEKTATAIPPQSASDYFYLGESYRLAADYEKAIREYSAAIQIDSRALRAYFGRAYCHQKLGNNEMAIPDYAVVIALRPQYAQAYSNLGEAYRRLGRYQEAFKNIQCALTIKPDLRFGYFNLALVEHALGQTEQAEKHYREAMQLSPRDADIYINLAQLYIEREMPDKAIQIARAGLEHAGHTAALYNNLGAALLLAEKPNNAIVYLKNAIQLDPAFADAHFNLGLAFERLGQIAPAIQAYTTALKIDGTLHAARFNLASVWEKKDKRKAAELWDQYIEHAQDDFAQKESIAEACRRLEQLQR